MIDLILALSGLPGAVTLEDVEVGYSPKKHSLDEPISKESQMLAMLVIVAV